MVALGSDYARGEGVPQDFVEARSWYEKAAGLGGRRAMNLLGLFNENGRGGPRDPAAARSWYQKGAELGDIPSMRNLARVYERGIGGPPDLAQAQQWAAKANTAVQDEDAEPAPTRPVAAPEANRAPRQGLPNR
jgi:TPR repeat protein